jgi:ribose 5-phosphate isomerase A
VLAFGAAATLDAVGHARLRDAPPTPDGGLLADYFGPVEEPSQLATRLAATPGVVEHGLFAPGLVHEILVARGDGVHREVFP